MPISTPLGIWTQPPPQTHLGGPGPGSIWPAPIPAPWGTQNPPGSPIPSEQNVPLGEQNAPLGEQNIPLPRGGGSPTGMIPDLGNLGNSAYGSSFWSLLNMLSTIPGGNAWLTALFGSLA